jgi:hypothetical protein
VPDFNFEREYGCTEGEWLRWLPGAVRDAELALAQPGEAHVDIASGQLVLRWTTLPPRQIALIRMPRMNVAFAFEGVSEPARAEFMRYFDLYMQRGGG